MSKFKFRIGQTVKHDYSGDVGTVVGMRNDTSSYCYKVEWQNGRSDWYVENVLREVV